jgi:hypothetical protein
MTKLERWLELLQEERDRRQKIDGSDPGARERLLEKLAVMGERLRAAPGWIEPTPAEKAHCAQELDRWLDGWLRERRDRDRP